MKPYYETDGITLYHGDCLEVTEWLAADVMVTDPPYGIGWATQGNGVSRAHPGIANDHSTEARDNALKAWGTRPAVVFGALLLPPPRGTRHVLVWQKPPDAGLLGANLGYRRDIESVYLIGDWPMVRPASRSSVLRSSATTINGYGNQHPHAKPLDLLCRLIEAAPPGIIADPFAGSGSTLLAARLSGRPAIGVEIEERYCELIASRLAQGLLL